MTSLLQIRDISSQYTVPCLGIFKISMKKAVESRMPANGNPTNEVALKIFSQIKLQSQILSFLFKPISLFSASVLVAGVGILIIALSPHFLLIVTGLALALIGGFGIGFFGAMTVSNGRELDPIISAYDDQAAQADRFMTKIKLDQVRSNTTGVLIEFTES